jgi:cytochrome c-type biogenesis protein CcmH/NrfG
METAEWTDTPGPIVDMHGKRPTPIVRDAHALLVRGIDALERNHIDEAVGLLRQTVDLDAQSFYGHLALGIALTRALEIPAAERALETAVRLEPNNFYAHLRMAELFHRVGVPTRMKEELQIALDLAETTEQKKIARDLLSSEEQRNPRRAWRPDFTKLLRGRGRKS